MNITPGEAFSLKHSSLSSPEDSFAESYRVETTEPVEGGMKVIARVYGYVERMIEGFETTLVETTETIFADGILTKEFYRVHIEPKDDATETTFTFKDVDGGWVLADDDSDATIIMGFGMNAYWAPSLEAWGTEEFINETAVRTDTWYHATTRKDWVGDVLDSGERLGKSLLIHAGSREAAMARMAMLGHVDVDVNLYTLRLRSDVKIHNEVIADQSDGWYEYAGLHTLGADVFVYENNFEDTDSISVSGPLSAFDIVKVQTVQCKSVDAKFAQSHNRSRMVMANA